MTIATYGTVCRGVGILHAFFQKALAPDFCVSQDIPIQRGNSRARDSHRALIDTRAVRRRNSAANQIKKLTEDRQDPALSAPALMQALDWRLLKRRNDVRRCDARAGRVLHLNGRGLPPQLDAISGSHQVN